MRKISKKYAIAVTGGRSYQVAIAAIGEGEAVIFYHEQDNPYDDRAIAATCHGDTIGYLPRDSWLTEALLDEGKGCNARVSRLSRGTKGLTGVTLEVQLVGTAIKKREFNPR